MTYLDLLEEHGGTSAPVLTGTLAVRTAEENPDHHLWNNNGTWWCHYTEHLPDYTKRRVRRNLHTAERAVARLLRDSVIHEIGGRQHA